jgi:selenocysteine lyase/cysteine desulfurase
MMAQLLEGFQSLANVTIHGRPDAAHRVGVASISVSGYDPQEVASILDSAFRIQVRSGLHCAPQMHRSLGTLDIGGTVRFSLGPLNTANQIELGIDAVRQLAISQ